MKVTVITLRLAAQRVERLVVQRVMPIVSVVDANLVAMVGMFQGAARVVFAGRLLVPVILFNRLLPLIQETEFVHLVRQQHVVLVLNLQLVRQQQIDRVQNVKTDNIKTILHIQGIVKIVFLVLLLK